MTTISQSIPDRSSPGSKGTAPSVVQQDGDEKYATGVTTSKIRVRNNITHLERENLANGRQIGRIVV